MNTSEADRLGARIAFLGPTLSTVEAVAIDPDLVVLPPAGMGDLVSAVRRFDPVAIVLIDGTFLQNMAVFHKEILDALSRGVAVIGAASMGALRAAEMDRLGMVGIGEIYSSFATGHAVDDDEVAVAHADAEFGFRPLSDPMVNIRATLDAAVAAGGLRRADAERLADAQKARHFPARHLTGLLDDAQELPVEEAALAALAGLVADGGVDVKRADARLAIAHAREITGTEPTGTPRPTMVPSAAYQATLERDVRVGDGDDLPTTFDHIRYHAALNDSEFADVWRAATMRVVVDRLAEELGLEPDDTDRTEARAAVAARLDVRDGSTDDRLAELDMTASEFDRLAESEAVVRRLFRWARSGSQYTRLTGPFIDELRLRGQYERARRAAGLFDRLAAQAGDDGALVTLDRLIQLQAALSGWGAPDDLDRYLRDQLLGDRAQFYDRLMVSVLALHELAGVQLEEAAPPVEPSRGTIPPPTTGRTQLSD